MRKSVSPLETVDCKRVCDGNGVTYVEVDPTVDAASIRDNDEGYAVSIWGSTYHSSLHFAQLLAVFVKRKEIPCVK